MVTDNHYRWDFIQLSTDTKPTAATSDKVADGSTLYTSDDSKLYVWYKDQWYEKTATGGGGGGGGITELTADDFDFPADNPTGVALWNLKSGTYHNNTDSTIKLYYSSNNPYVYVNLGSNTSFTVLFKSNSTSISEVGVDDYSNIQMIRANANGTGLVYSLVGFNKVADNLTTNLGGYYALDAHQGYVLKGYLDAILTETFTFTLTDGTTVTKNICYKAS